MQKSKMAVWGGLTNSEKEEKWKAKEKRKDKSIEYRFPRIAGRDKKAFLSEQCKEIEENNIMRNIRDLVNKIRDTKGTFYTKMGSIKDRNGKDLTKAEDIKRRWHILIIINYQRTVWVPGVIQQIPIGYLFYMW